jgi:hypothetical protein
VAAAREPSRSGGGRRVVVVIVGVLPLTALAGLLFIADALRPRPLDLYKPTAAESRAATTTIPIPVAGCASFVRVEKATAIAADETAFGWNPKATPAKARKALSELHVALANAMRYAQGPMRQRLSNADLSIVGAQFAIASWHGVVPQHELVTPVSIDGGFSDTLSQMRVIGYTHLRVAERLLGSTCGGRLAPDADRILPAQLRYPTSTDQP